MGLTVCFHGVCDKKKLKGLTWWDENTCDWKNGAINVPVKTDNEVGSHLIKTVLIWLQRHVSSLTLSPTCGPFFISNISFSFITSGKSPQRQEKIIGKTWDEIADEITTWWKKWLNVCQLSFKPCSFFFFYSHTG